MWLGTLCGSLNGEGSFGLHEAVGAAAEANGSHEDEGRKSAAFHVSSSLSAKGRGPPPPGLFRETR
jgi:hypothetical protein